MICFLRMTLLLPRRRPLVDAVTISVSSSFAGSGSGSRGSSSIGSSADVSSFSDGSSSSSSSSIIRLSASSLSLLLFDPEVRRAFGWGISESSSPSSDMTCMLESSPPVGVVGFGASGPFLGFDAALENACMIPELAPRFRDGAGFLAGIEEVGFSAVSWAGCAGFGSSLIFAGASACAALDSTGFACGFTAVAAAALTPAPCRSLRRTRGLVTVIRPFTSLPDPRVRASLAASASRAKS